MLIEAGAAVDKYHHERATPLFVAAQEGHFAVVRRGTRHIALGPPNCPYNVIPTNCQNSMKSVMTHRSII